MTKLLLAKPLIPLALIMVGACGSEPDIKMENASVGEVAREMREEGTAKFLNPGKWRHRVTLLEMDVPGLPPEARSMMENATDRAQQFEHCLTPDRAKKPSEDFFTKADQNCRYEHFRWGDGKIDMKLNCTTSGGRMTMVQTGEYQPDAFSMAVTQVIENAGAGSAAKMTIKAKVDAKRIGACDGTEAADAAN